MHLLDMSTSGIKRLRMMNFARTQRIEIEFFFIHLDFQFVM